MIAEEFRLDDEIAVIAFSGYAWIDTLALSLTQAGARVVLAAPGQRDTERAAAMVNKAGGDALAIVTDLTSDRDVGGMVKKALSAYGKIDVLINALNPELWKPMLEMTATEWRRAIDSSLNANFICSRNIGTEMVNQRRGSIVNVVSGLAQRGVPNGTVTCAGMGAILQLTRTLALEWAAKHVRVNAVGMGWLREQGEAGIKDPLAGYIPMRRRGVPEDVIPLIMFLASQASSYLSGNIYTVDGGLMARG